MGWSWELEPDRIWSRGSLEVSLCDWRRFATAGANKVLQIPASNGNDAQRVEAIEQERMASGLRDHTWMDGVEVRVRLVHSSTHRACKQSTHRAVVRRQSRKCRTSAAADQRRQADA